MVRMEQKVLSECSGVLLFGIQLTVLHCYTASLAGPSLTSSSTDNTERFSRVSSCWRDRNESLFGICFQAYTKCLCPFLDHIKFSLFPLDSQKVSGNKFVINFPNTGVGAREASMLGCRPSLLLQHPLCPSWEEGPGCTWSAAPTAVANSIPLTPISHFCLFQHLMLGPACVPDPAVRRMDVWTPVRHIPAVQAHSNCPKASKWIFMLQALQPGTATRGRHRAAGVITSWPGICGSHKNKSCPTLGRWEQNTLSLIIFHSFPTGDDKHGVC